MENEDGEFEKVEGRGPDFNYRINFVFYATLGTAVNDFERPNEAYPGGQSVRVVLDFDAHPWEIGVEIRAMSNDSVIWYRPPRYYAREIDETVVEIVSIPARVDTYTVTVGDTFGDGLGIGAAGVRVTSARGDRKLGSTAFETGHTASFTFSYDPPAFSLAPTSPPETTRAPSSASAYRIFHAEAHVLVMIALLLVAT